MVGILVPGNEVHLLLLFFLDMHLPAVVLAPDKVSVLDQDVFVLLVHVPAQLQRVLELGHS